MSDDDDVPQLPQAVIDVAAQAAGAVAVGLLDDDVPAVEGTVERDGLAWRLQVAAYPGGTLVALSIAAEPVPAARRAAVGQLLQQVNWGLLVGDGEIDDRDGTVRVRTSLCAFDAPVDEALAAGLILPNLGTAALVLTAVAAVAAGADPEAEAERILDTIDAEGVDLRID